MGLVHVRLDLEDEGGKIGAERIDHAAVGLARQGALGHAQELLQKGLDAEVRQRGAEEHGRQAARTDLLEVKFAACAEQLHVVDELDVYKRQAQGLDGMGGDGVVDELGVGVVRVGHDDGEAGQVLLGRFDIAEVGEVVALLLACLLYTSRSAAAAP